MRFLQNLSIAVKILIPPAVLVLALVVVSLAALYGLNFQCEMLNEINHIALDRIKLVDGFNALSEQVQSDVFRISVLRFMDLPEEEIKPIQERMEQGLNDLNVIYGQILLEWSLDEEERAIVERMKEPLDAFREQARQAVAVVSDNPSFGVILVRAATVPFAEFRSTLTEFLDYQQAKIARAEAEAVQRATMVSTAILALALGITLVGMVATILVSNHLIAQPIRSMTGLMGRLAGGDLSVEVGGLERRDEIGGMARAVEVFRQNAVEKAQAEADIARASEALRKSERILNATGKIGKIGGWEHDLATGKAVWTQALYDITETPYDQEPPGVDEHFSYYPPRYRQAFEQAYNQAVKNGTPFDLELQAYTSKKTLIWCRAQGEPVYEDDKCVAMRGTLQDITERKRAEADIARASEALRESQRQLATLMSNLPGMAYRCANRPGWPMAFVSEGCLALTGYPVAELTKPGRVFYGDLIHPGDRHMVWNTIQEAVRAGEPFVIEYRLRNKKDEERWVWEQGRAIGQDNSGTAILEGFISDITERKRAEQALKEHSDRLEDMVEDRTRELREAQEQLVRQEKLAILGQLAGGMGHELRNPLGAIKNAVYFLNMVLQDPDVETQEMLEILDKEVDAAEKIISGLLDFARTKPPTRRKVDLNRIVREALARIPPPDAPDVEFVYQLDADPPVVLADPDQLCQVLDNVIRNGIQAMRSGGILTVRTAVESPEWVTVSVTDTGVGIPEENLGKIFEPLFTTKAKGIGLGLAVVKMLVEGHGGTIGVASEVGEGSTFTVRLPLGARAAAGA